MSRIFLDSSVLIAASASNVGASHAVIVMAEIGLIKAIVSEQVIEECERNLQKKLPQSLETFRLIISKISPEILPQPSFNEFKQWINIIEAKDAPILAAAITAKVTRLLTLNTKDFTPNVSNLSNLRLQTPGQFVQEVRNLIVQGIE